MCKDIEESWFHASQRKQQDIDIELDKREDKKTLQSAGHPEDTSLRDWYRP